MCGITGIISDKAEDYGLNIHKMTNTLIHRGPDDWGYKALSYGKSDLSPLTKVPPEKASNVFMGHRRLSIIDLEGTKQPLCNEDGSVWVVFNGEIYNYCELSDELKGKGHILKEKGDTEVLVHLWEEVKEDICNKLVGMFAFAIFDTRDNTLFLARDRFGQKPLYYFKNDQYFAFASELQAFWQLSGFPKDNINTTALCNYFKYCYIPAPKTVFKNVFSLLPGHFLVLKNNLLSVREYWRPRVTGSERTVDLDEIQNLLDQSVKLRLKADVPVGVFLSGGIDSSLVTASMKQQPDMVVKTFNIALGNFDCDESESAKIIANHLHTDHHTFQVEPDFIKISQKLVQHYGQPFADYSSVPTYYVSRETVKHVKVALAGDGGDELFAGYERYLNYHKYITVGKCPYLFRKIIYHLLKTFSPGTETFQQLPDFIVSAGNVNYKGENASSLFHHYWRDKAFNREFQHILNESEEEELNVFMKRYSEAESDNPLEKWMEVDQRTYLSDDILTKVDIASMANSLECRAPFMDHRLAQYANNIPASKKIQYGQSKFLLRQLALKRLPNEIINLPKKGFTMPLAIWLRNELKDWGYSVIFDNINFLSNYLNREIVELFWNEHQSAKVDHSMRLWMLITILLWQKSVKSASENS